MSEETQADQGLQQELNNLDQKIDGGQPVEQAETTTSDTNLVEQDGELLLSVDTDGEEPTQDDPETGQSSKQDNLSNSEEQQEDTSDQEPDAYQGKSREDLVEMLSNAQSKIGQQGSELGDLRKSIETQAEEMTGEEAFESLTSKDVQIVLAEQKSKLNKIDPYDESALNEQRELITQLESDLITKTTNEGINDRYNQVDNENFIANQQKVFDKQGVELDNEEFNDIIKQSYQYSQNGKLNDASVYKSMIDIYGVDQVQKHYSMSGEAKARQEIKNAGAKTTERVDVRGSGKSAKLVNINKLSGRELNKALDNLSIDDLKRLKSKYINN
jgi:hypothetical protein